MAGYYEHDYRGFAGFMRSGLVRKAMEDVAEHGADYLRAIAPVETGEYKESVEVTSGISLKGDRAAAFIHAKAKHAAAIQFGNEHVRNPPKPMDKVIDYLEHGA